MTRLQTTLALTAVLLLLGCSDSLAPSDENLTPDIPELSFPENEYDTGDRNPLLIWSEVDGASRYHLQVDSDPGFTNPRIDEAVLSGNSFQPDFFLETGVRYYWRVASANRYGESHYTPAWYFTCSPVSPPIPQPLAPADGSETLDSTPTFRWNTVDGADYYALIVDDDPEFGSPTLFENEIEATEFTPDAPLPRNRTYYWKVCTRASGVWSDWSEPWSFDLLTDPNGFYYSFDGTMDWTWDEPQIQEFPDEGRAYFNTCNDTGFNLAYTDFSHTLAVGDIFEVEIDEESMTDIDGDQRIVVGFLSNLFDEYIHDLEDGIFVSYQSYWVNPVLFVDFFQDGVHYHCVPRMLLGIGTYRVRVKILGPHSYELTLWRNGIFYSQDEFQVDQLDLTQIETNYAVIRNARNYSWSNWRGRYEGYVNELSLGQ